MKSTSRFLTPSRGLNLKSLVSKARPAVLISLGVAVGVHSSLTRVAGSDAERQAAKPLTTQFVKRQPRLTKPLEMKKTPRPRRRQMRRTMVSVRARVDRGGAVVSKRSPRLLQSLARPAVSVARTACGESPYVAIDAVAGQILGAKESEHAMDTSLEMLDVDALDTGRYQAMVIQDPSDKRQIKGYLHLAVALPTSVRQMYGYNTHGVSKGLRRLIARVNEWTDLRASLSHQVTFDSAEFFRTPWVYLALNFGMDPTRREVESLGKYLLTGGFFYFEGSHWREWRGEFHLFRFVTAALESQGHAEGVDWEFEFVPDSHAIFHCYYDFPDGVPIGGSTVCKRLWGTGRDDDIHPYSKGVNIDGRMVVFNTNQGLLNAWAHWGTSYGGGAYPYDPTAQFRFGINTIIFALTQEGSITKRVMDAVR